MGVIDTVRDAAFVVQKIDNVELLGRVVELQQKVYALEGPRSSRCVTVPQEPFEHEQDLSAAPGRAQAS
jgi:hypothetical protein